MQELKKAVMWNFEEAATLIRELDAQREKSGWRFTITGSVIRDGSSSKDLDIVTYPHCSTKKSLKKLYKLFDARGWKLRVGVQQMHDFWREKGSKDRKHVEVWKTEDGRRVDVFVLS